MVHYAWRLVVATLCAAFAAAAWSQDYPVKPVRFLVGGAAGSGGDLQTRLLAAAMTKFLGQNVFVENMLGAGGDVARTYVAKQAAPDGYTLLNATIATGVATLVFRKVPGFDMRKDFTPISIVAESPFFLLTNTDTGWTTLDAFVAHAKANPRQVNYGAAGTGEATDLYMEAIKQKFGLDIVGIPYRAGSAAYSLALQKNEVQVIFGVESTLLRTKNTRPLAITGNRRLPKYPDLPTLAEVGIPIPSIEYVIVGPAGIPRPIVDRLHAAIARSLETPEVKEPFAKLGFAIVSSTPQTAARRIVEESERVLEIARQAGIVPQ